MVIGINLLELTRALFHANIFAGYLFTCVYIDVATHNQSWRDLCTRNLIAYVYCRIIYVNCPTRK